MSYQVSGGYFPHSGQDLFLVCYLEEGRGHDGVCLLQCVGHGCGDPRHQGARHHAHRLRVLVGQQRQQGGEAAEAGWKKRITLVSKFEGGVSMAAKIESKVCTVLGPKRQTMT